MIWFWGRWGSYPFVQNGGIIGFIINIFLFVIYTVGSIVVLILLSIAITLLLITTLPFWFWIIFL